MTKRSRRIVLALLCCLLAVAAPGSAEAGWYLLAPESHSVEETLRHNPKLTTDYEIARATLDLRKPLSNWVQVRSFDTAPECEEFLAHHRDPRGPRTAIQRLRSWLYSDHNSLTILDIREVVPDEIAKKYPKLQSAPDDIQASRSRCIASDDRRLGSMLVEPPKAKEK